MVLLVVDTQKLITTPGEQSYKYYNEFMWKGRYAECISVEETIERMKGEAQNGRGH